MFAVGILMMNMEFTRWYLSIQHIALAAVLGAVPGLGSYWPAFPAVLDLWLAQDRGPEALLLLFCQFIPSQIVDDAFYAEIKVHPYLTGLAVAGGMFWLGYEGAVFGPLLLCVVVAGISIYMSLVGNPAETQPKTQVMTGA